MKIQELLNVEKALIEKKKELEELRKEAEEFQMMIDVNMKQNDTINIHDVYVVTYENIHYFCLKKKEKGQIQTWIRFYDIFSSREILFTSWSDFLVCNYNSLARF